MGILWAFAPFVAFALVNYFGHTTLSLFVGAAVSAVLLLRDLLVPGKTPKILEVGTFALFSGLAIFALLTHATWSVIAVRACVDGGLLLIILVSLALGKPFTVPYARENVSPDLWNTPQFMHTNRVITAAWALAFALMLAAELALLWIPGMPRRLGIIVIVAALVGAIKFTGWYPQRNAGAQKSA